MGAVPFLPQSFFVTPANTLGILRFGKIWFSNCGGSLPDWECNSNNYFHVVASGFTSSGDWGWTWSQCNETFLFTGTIAAFPGTTFLSHQETLDHELGHQFDVNPCSPDCEHHDTRNAWCDSTNHCALGGSSAEQCLMYSSTLAQRQDGVNRFDTTDLQLGISSSCTVPCGPLDNNGNPTDITYDPPAGAIRSDDDPR